jgi:hypothetical protein
MKRKLRIAFSAVCGIICLLLIALWVRSHWKLDLLTLPISSARAIQVAAVQGDITFRAPPVSYFRSKGYLGPVSSLRDYEVSPAPPKTSSNRKRTSKIGIRWSSLPRGSGGHIVVPFWMIVVLSAAMSLPLLKSLRWRFSLRTLLIAMTLVAIVLGVAAVMLRGS